MHRQNWQRTRTERICEKTFPQSNYHFSLSLNPSESIASKNLTKDSVPTVFSFADHLKKTTKLKHSLYKRHINNQRLQTSLQILRSQAQKETLTHDYTHANKI